MSVIPDNSSETKNEDSGQNILLTRRIDELEKKVGEKGQDERKLFTSLENVAKLVSAVAGAVVALGFVFYMLGSRIVNEYYAIFGLRVFELNKPIFLGAGIVFVLVFLLPLVTSLFIFRSVLFMQQKKKMKQGTFITIFFLPYLLVFSFTQWGLLTFLMEKAPSIITCVKTIDTACVPIGGQAIIAMFLFLIMLWPDDFIELFGGRLISFILIFMSLMGYFLLIIEYWSIGIYPNIHSAFAGGEMTKVKVVLSTEADKRQFTEIDVEVNDFVTDELLVLDEGSDYITVVNNSCNAVKLSKGLIENILFIPTQTDIKTLLEECRSQSITPTTSPSR